MTAGFDSVNKLADACTQVDALFHALSDTLGMPYAVKAFSIVLGAQAAYQDNPKGAVETVERYINEAMERQSHEREKEEKNEAPSSAPSPGKLAIVLGDSPRQGALSGVDGNQRTKKPE